MGDELYRDDYFLLTAPEPSLLVLDRLNQPFESIAAAQQAMRDVRRVVREQSERGADRMLMDFSGGPARNDDEFEQATAAYIREVDGTFPRVAVVVGTKVGLLQLQRIRRSMGLRMEAFESREQALGHLRG